VQIVELGVDKLCVTGAIFARLSCKNLLLFRMLVELLTVFTERFLGFLGGIESALKLLEVIHDKMTALSR
jgi:hypothetical protein